MDVAARNFEGEVGTDDVRRCEWRGSNLQVQEGRGRKRG